MKKLGLLIVGTFLLAACDATPKGNKSILPVVHDEAVEHVEHHQGGHENHDTHATEAHENQDAHVSTEKKDSLNKATESHTAEKKDSAH